MSAEKILILASASQRRADLLKQIGIKPNIIFEPNCDENPKKRELPKKYVQRQAQQKAEKTIRFLKENPPKRKNQQNSKYFILTADTIVAAGRRIIQKPKNQKDAENALKILSGKRHRVYTNVSLFITENLNNHNNIIKRNKTIITIVTMKRLSLRDIETYIKSNEWEGKAGAYAIQGRADAFVKQINGSYSNVVGLPLYQTQNLLQGCGYLI